MSNDAGIVRNLGEQPITHLMSELGLSAGDLVKASAVPLTYKMVARARKGRRLTANTKNKVREALERAAGRAFSNVDLFDY